MKIEFKVTAIYYAVEYVGKNIGKPITVIDLFGCTRNCNWCYINHKKSKFNAYINYDIEDILFRISNYNSLNIKITGGEPTEQNNLYELIESLQLHGYYVTLETNGEQDNKAYDIVDELIVDIKPYSSGKITKLSRILDLKQKYPNVVLKGVIQNQADIDYYHSNFRLDDLWLFREEKEGRTEDIIDRLLLNNNWRICFRTDRLIGVDFDRAYKNVYGDEYERKR